MESWAQDTSVLVVDDELAVRELLADGLEQFGYSARMASTAAEAMEIVRNEAISLVLSDIEMPGGSGMELLGQIKAHDADLDVIMVTGAIDADTAVSAIRHGAADYVTKPFNLNEVQIVVERTLEKRRLVLENRAYQERLEELVALRTREVMIKKQEVERLYADLENSYESTLQALVTALDFRDNETHGHSYRVVEYATLVAGRMGIDGAVLRDLRRGAILHDVGKIGVPDAVLRKPGKLNAEEWEEMKKHPAMGYRMLQHIPFLESSLSLVLSHQERFDGSGYPRGLAGDEIPLGARVFAVVDTFDAMTSDRPYRPAQSIQTARAEIERCTPAQFDPRVTSAFLSIEDSMWHEIRERAHETVVDLDEQVKQVFR